MNPFDHRPPPRLIFGAGRLAELPGCVQSLGASAVLLVTDPGIVAAGHARRAVGLLEAAGLGVTVYEGSRPNPTESDVEECRDFAAKVRPDVLVGLGGGSSMDTAKGCNFLLHNGGRMADYRGYGLAPAPLLPFIAVPTTAGTGSECQSYALVSRDGSHEKMACGDPKALARVAILDPELTVSQPHSVATLTALDALSHAVESAVCTRRNPLSAVFSREAFRLIAAAITPLCEGTATLDDRGRLMLGAALGGAAIENSMLGAAHAAANPLTACFGLAHGHAVAMMLPHVVRFNSRCGATAAIYDELASCLGAPLLPWLEATVAAAHLAAPAISESAVPDLAEAATRQWTGQFNPRPVGFDDFTALYQLALHEPATVAP
jgi:alcohol dehydrogenase